MVCAVSAPDPSGSGLVVLTFVTNSWGNRGRVVEDAEVAAAREALRQPAPTGHP